MSRTKNIALLNNPHIEEILNVDELLYLIENETPLKHYIGFEISGNPHIGSTFITMSVIRDLLKLNAEIIIFLADWHSWINHKFGGDHEFIKEVAKKSFKHHMIASAISVGIDPDKIKFVLGSDLYEENPVHWANFMEANQHVSLARIKRSISIMGRKEGEIVDFAQLTYPTLQVADIFTMQRNIVHAGIDQRKVHVIARQLATKMKIMPIKDKDGNVIKPISIHHKLSPSLLKPPKWPISAEELKHLSADLKMSKSNPKGAIFLNDSPDEIRKKVLNAFCPQVDLSYNPVAIWAKMFIFDFGKTLFIKRPEKWGGNVEIKDWNEFKEIYLADKLHPQDLKMAVAEGLIELLEPARKYLKDQPEVQEMQEKILNKISR